MKKTTTAVMITITRTSPWPNITVSIAIISPDLYIRSKNRCRVAGKRGIVKEDSI